jgi:hypothetical protein
MAKRTTKQRAKVRTPLKRKRRHKARRAPKPNRKRKAAKQSHSAKARGKVRKKPQRVPSGDAFEIAFKLLRKGNSQKDAATFTGISTRRFRRYLRGNKLARYRKGRWLITDQRPRSIRIFTDGQQRAIKVRGFGRASLAMKHRTAVRWFLETNDESKLEPYRGLSVTDTSRQKHILETRPNVLYRLANAGSDADMRIYRLMD